jgi:hemin uptake protein HemP
MTDRTMLRLACAPGPCGRDQAEPAPGCPRHNARELTGGAAEAEVVLDGKVYHLRITKAGKLILNK